MNLKNKETQLFESLNKLDSIADLIKNSKEESSYLKKLSSQLEKEKDEIMLFTHYLFLDSITKKKLNYPTRSFTTDGASMPVAGMKYFKFYKTFLLNKIKDKNKQKQKNLKIKTNLILENENENGYENAFNNFNFNKNSITTMNKDINLLTDNSPYGKANKNAKKIKSKKEFLFKEINVSSLFSFSIKNLFKKYFSFSPSK